MSFKYTPFSRKQLQLLTWWTENSPYFSYNGVIAEGAVRAGKTLVMSLSFVFWAMNRGNGLQYAICGKTVGSLERNVISALIECLLLRKYIVHRRGNRIIVSNGKVTNTFFLFGGKDERSQDLIQGITLAGVLLDEVALMPRSFVEQALARCSVAGSKYWFNCNPEGPMHWFYQEHVLMADEKKYIRIHFDLEDNPSLDESTILRYKTMFSGVFYRRFILGEWVAASGVIYDCFTEEKNTYTDDMDIPWQVRESYVTPWYSCDYGTFNPFVLLEGYYFQGTLYITNEWQYDGRKALRQKSDIEYVDDFKNFKKDRYKACIIDPSASSFIAAMSRNGEKPVKANNDVFPGISKVYQMMQSGRIKINKRNCSGLIKELGMYIWNEKNALMHGKEEPVKQYDHFCDALRYLVMKVVMDFDAFGVDVHGH